MNKEIPLITKKMMDLLKSNGHTCAMYDMTNGALHWCNKDECEKTNKNQNMEIIQKQEEEFVKKLQKEGHTCISIMESYPMQVGWCKHSPCKNNN